MKGTKISLKQFTEIVNKHESFIVNYGKGLFTDEDIKEEAYWDEDKQAYASETGYWNMKLLYEIARGEVENTSVEIK